MSRRVATPAARRAASPQFGKRLKAARGKLSLLAATSSIRDYLPDSVYLIGPETLRQWENGGVSEAVVDPVVILALSRVYDVDVSRISPMHAATVERIAALIPANLVTA